MGEVWASDRDGPPHPGYASAQMLEAVHRRLVGTGRRGARCAAVRALGHGPAGRGSFCPDPRTLSGQAPPGPLVGRLGRSR